MRPIPEKHLNDLRKADDMFTVACRKELEHAREKFPSSVCCLAALTEEVGELAQAMLKYAAGKWPIQRVHEEAAQVVAMAYRCALEGDPSMTRAMYSEPEHKQNGENQ